jgi:uncharacterized protein with PIN domain
MTFVADSMLGRLAKWLRALGYDVLYTKKLDEQAAMRFLETGRIILTRNTRLKSRLPEDKAILIEHDRLEDQLAQLVVSGVIKFDPNAAFRRCMRCNSPLKPLSRLEAADLVPEHVYHSYSHFFSCPACGRVYWPGTHHEGMKKLLEKSFLRSSN